ncbi:MAG: hypothetical protein IIB03_01120 [Acidobacteria bacterium]|nr:hypothetical protein [Acidobacteriota bacterium]
MADENYDVIIVGSGMAGFLVAARIAEKGVNPRNGEPLNLALVERGPYLPGTPRPGYGVPLRRRLFTNITLIFGTCSEMAWAMSRPPIRDSGISSRPTTCGR